MKKLADFLFSASLMAAVFIVFAVSIAIATFIENDFGSATARALVYNAHWFEVLLLLGIINLTGRVIIKKLYTLQKFSVFLFHASFIVILAGSAITRYTGWEGTLSIREGKSSNAILTDKAYIKIVSGEKAQQVFPAKFSVFRKKFKKNFKLQEEEYTVELKSYIPGAYMTIRPSGSGLPMAELIYADSMGRKNKIAATDRTVKINNLLFSFSDEPVDSFNIVLSHRSDSLFFTAPFPVVVSGMGSESFTVLRNGEQHFFKPGVIYRFKDQVVVLSRFIPLAQLAVEQLPPSSEDSYDALILEISHINESKEVIVLGKAGYTGIPEQVNLLENNFIITYGSLHRVMPFELKLNDFIVERYPGSRSPSSFESQVTLIDNSRNLVSSKRIYMNNILKYKGYRFYQSSYDQDEKGTILSVNHDMAGTSVTYAGYALMAAGMVLSLFMRNSRFRQLVGKKHEKTRQVSGILVLICLTTFSGFSQSPDMPELKTPDLLHARSFSRVLIQNNDGRIEPVSTLSSEVLRKLMRSDSYKGMNADQVFLGMMSDPSIWQYQPIIRTTNSDIKEMLGKDDRYFSFTDFFEDNAYKLEPYVGDALRKKPVHRSKFDTEIIKLDEKINICYMVFTGDLLRIFPVPGDSNHTWHNQSGIKGLVTSEDSVFTNNVMNLYAQEVRASLASGNWTNPERILNAIKQYQQKYTPEIIPSKHKVSAEIILNRSDVFSRISKYYGIIGFILLILQFVSIFYTRLKLKVPVTISIVLIISLFTVHTLGLIIRWYVSGHAPLSNGYEALTYVAWASVLAGLIFARRLPVTLSITSLLASLILFVAHLSWMDPQITNLVPVLKSYWLVIHVAVITASYAFLGMSALMAFLNLIMMALHTRTNREQIGNTIREFTDIIEMALTVGLYLLTIGVFLGAVWANESWGRYWGWDPKETWALVTLLVYAFILHMRMIPGMGGIYNFNLASLLGFSSVIMTYFGVNYYLSGLHSYAKGDPLPVPDFVYYTIAIIIVAAVAAYIRREPVSGKR